MANMRVFKPSFAGGELSPEMFGRIDDAKFQNGAASLQNLISTPLGPAEKRPGFEFVNFTKLGGAVRLIPFNYSTTQTMVIEIGPGYFRFHTMGETLRYSSTQPAFKPSFPVTYTVANPTVMTRTAHGMTTGDPIVLAKTGIPPFGSFVAYPAGLNYGPYTVDVIDANTFHVIDTLGVFAAVTAPPVHGGLALQPNYAIGALASFGGHVYYRLVIPPDYFPDIAGLDTDPSADSFWIAMPSDLTYEIPNVYAADDLFNIHYVQSNDIITLVHPSYPPYELRRLGAELWTFTPIVFGPTLVPPTGVAVSGSPGYQARISTITLANPALITTVTNHTLSLGDGIYIKGLTAIIGGSPAVFDGFYLVSDVPLTGGGALIPNELHVMDYSGNILDASGWSSYTGSATIQFGSKIFDITNYYTVTALASDGVQESAISAEVSVLNNLNVTGSFNTITWAAVPNAFRYFVYKRRNGLYGYIGETTPDSLTFNDNNIAADMSITPPIYDPVFGGAGDYPGAVTYFQQRRSFAGTNNKPQNLWMSKTGTESDFSYSLPIKDTDRIAIGIAARQSSTIQHIVPLNQLVLLTNASEISVSPTNSDTITPSTIGARPQSYIGASNVQPTIVNNTMVYCANRGGHVREMGYQWQVGGYITGDISLRAAHLFDNLSIADQAFMKSPWQIVWFVSSAGTLLGLTYIPEEQIGAWHHHVTDGAFVSVACVAEGVEDRLYAVIRRTIQGSDIHYIERMSTRNFVATEDCFFVDSGATYDGVNGTSMTMHASRYLPFGPPPHPLEGTYNIVCDFSIFSSADIASVITLSGSDGNEYRFTILTITSGVEVNTVPSPEIPLGVTFGVTAIWSFARVNIGGLTWLEGKTVAILADGAVDPQQVVTGGAVTLQYPAVKVTIGLPYTSALDTLPLVMQIDGMGQGRMKNVNRVWVRVYRSSAIFAGPSPDDLVQYKQRTTESYGSPPNLVTDEVEIVVPASWQSSGQIYVEHSDPLPLTVVGLTIEAASGG